ncbi:MAG: hypothetical protein JWO86_744 [Myxococcaceae bacterium]|nr:hypothetical protein [Myxococcaceae bacterium]MEA2747541.1 hypothetical protein [Myxococcales bacterium]
MEVGRSTTRMMLPALVQRTTMKLVRPSLPAASAPPPPIGPAPRSFWCTPDPRLVILCDPDSERASGFRVLRDGLLAKGLPRVLAVSSACPGDGKTTCATNLALALAEQTRERLLLVDANFFAPSLASMFSIDEYATSGQGGLQAQPWSAPFKLTSLGPRLDLATIVLSRGAPLPRIDHESLVRLLGAFFFAGYQRIILDAPALEGSPAVRRLLDVADGVLLAVRAGHTTERALRRAAEQIGPRKMMGAALMDSRLDSER